MQKVIEWIGIGAVVLVSALIMYQCHGPIFPVPVKPVATAIIVHPIAITPAVQHALPAGQTGHTQIDIPPVTPHPGVIPVQHVVPTDQGNTVVVTTYNIDWGFKLVPQAFVGYDGDVFAGVGVNFFRVWRIDLSGLVSYGFREAEIRAGGAVTFAIDNNLRIGASYQIDPALKNRVGACVALSL
jgi:hypothetical protein